MTDAALDAAHDGLRAAGIDFVSGLPDGWQRPLHERVELDGEIRYVPVCNEGVGFSICAGAWLGGRKPALIMENSGLRVASEYIARISLGTGVPVTLLCSYRGDVGETVEAADQGKALLGEQRGRLLDTGGRLPDPGLSRRRRRALSGNSRRCCPSKRSRDCRVHSRPIGTAGISTLRLTGRQQLGPDSENRAA
jgi:sulfopyruvate decarboxylase TPP-binding subunit